MDRLIYTAMTGASHTMQQQASVAQNLANINTPGFRSTIDTFRSVPLVGEGLPTRTFVVDSTSGTDFTPGVTASHRAIRSMSPLTAKAGSRCRMPTATRLTPATAASR